MDLLAEIDRKGLGMARVVVGAGLPADGLTSGEVLRVDLKAAASCDDGEMAVLDSMIGQLLAVFRCLASGRRPDSPSQDSVITRVVSGFQIHSRNGDR
jgi:tagatose-6-phosphate ketose/aldose isomerase